MAAYHSGVSDEPREFGVGDGEGGVVRRSGTGPVQTRGVVCGAEAAIVVGGTVPDDNELVRIWVVQAGDI